MSTSTDVIAYDPTLFPKLVDQDPEAVRKRFAERFQASETIEDLFNVLNGTTSQDMIDRRISIQAVAWAPFESERGVIPLAICDAHDLDTGEVFEFVTASEMLTMFIRRAELIGALPFKARIDQKTTRSGNKALNFVAVKG